MSGFSNLEVEKQNWILNAAMKEFAEKGFAGASTNRIVKEANISKGLLFHYFDNKKTLYLYVKSFAMDEMAASLYAKINFQEPDLFQRYRDIALLKLGIYKQYPDLGAFLKTAYFETDITVVEEIKQLNQHYVEYGYMRILDKIDTTMFKKDVDIEKACNTLQFVTEGILAQFEEMIKQQVLDQDQFDACIHEFLQQLESYFEFLKALFYPALTQQ